MALNGLVALALEGEIFNHSGHGLEQLSQIGGITYSLFAVYPILANSPSLSNKVIPRLESII